MRGGGRWKTLVREEPASRGNKGLEFLESLIAEPQTPPSKSRTMFARWTTTNNKHWANRSLELPSSKDGLWVLRPRDGPFTLLSPYHFTPHSPSPNRSITLWDFPLVYLITRQTCPSLSRGGPDASTLSRLVLLLKLLT